MCGSIRALPRGYVLLVIAHPDDEAMFFVPTIDWLVSNRVDVRILCLSNGGADGLGQQRTEEIGKSAASLGILEDSVRVLDVGELQDGFAHVWNDDAVAEAIYEYIGSRGAPAWLLTFDGWGVSGHPNHRDTHRGVRRASA